MTTNLQTRFYSSEQIANALFGSTARIGVGTRSLVNGRVLGPLKDIRLYAAVGIEHDRRREPRTVVRQKAQIHLLQRSQIVTKG